MTQISFETAEDLVQHVNDQTILQSEIVTIIEHDGRWYLFHF